MGWSPPSGGGSGGSLASQLAAFTSTLGVDMVDTSAGGVAISELGSGGIILADDGGGGTFITSTDVLRFVAPSNGFYCFTAANLAGLPTPAVGQTPAFGFAQSGHIYFYPTGGPWSLVA
jgi:hypothetical protein